MKQIIKEDDQALIIREDDRVIKEYSQPKDYIDRNWLYHYQAFSKMYGGVITVHEANQHRIVMDYIEGESLKTLLFNTGGKNPDHEFTYKCFAAILQALANMAEFSSMKKTVWFHGDTGPHNFMYTGKEFILIDPDSFIFRDNPFPGTFVSTLYPLQKILETIHFMHENDYKKKMRLK